MNKIFYLIVGLLLTFSYSLKANSNFILEKNTDEEILINFKLSEYSINKVYSKEYGLYNIIKANGSSKILLKSAPELPKFTKSVIIPDKAEMELKVVYESFKEYKNIKILPSKGNFTRDKNPDDIPLVYGKYYQNDEFFPAVNANLNSPYIFRDYRAQSINIYPFKYNPKTQTLRVYTEIKIKISKKSDNGENQFIRTKNYNKTASSFNEIYKSHFINYNNNTKYTPLSESGDLLIITDSNFVGDLQDFVVWKTQTGRKVNIVRVQDIGNTSTAIKNTISNYYNNSNLAYVLLVGDASEVTTNTISGVGHSDNAYGYLSGNDSYPEIIIGRFSADQSSHVLTQVERSVDYEKSPNLTNAFYKTNAGIASDQGPGDDNEMDYEHIRNIQSDMLGFTYSNNVELFDGSQGGNDANGNPTATMLSSEINSGVGSIMYTGHGSSFSFVTTSFSSTDISNLDNADMLPFIYSVACVNGDFVSNTCFAEVWLRSEKQGEPIGAIATLMSTINQSWNPPMHAQDEMTDILCELDSSNIKRTFGGIAMDGCAEMNDAYGSAGDEMTDTWTVFGDPTLMIRTDSATAMVVSHQPYLNLSATSMAVNVNMNNAQVTLSKGDSLYASTTVNSGIANLNFPAIANMDTITLTVTAFNKIPYIADILISAGSQSFISSTYQFVNDSLSNNNAEADNGETFKLGLCIENLGSKATDSVLIKLSSNSQKLNITDSIEYVGLMSIGDSLILSNAFEVELDTVFTNQETVNFSIEISDTASTWNNSFSLNVNAPELEITSSNLIEITGNGNGKPDAGESMQAQIELKNTGQLDCHSIIAEYSANSSDINILNPVKTINLLKQDSSFIISFDFDISQNTNAGSRITSSIEFESGIYTADQNIKFRVGVVDEDFETGDLTAFAWQFSGDKDWVIDNNEVYEGNYSVRSGLSSSDDDMESILEIPIEVSTADSISFYAKVSCEDGSQYGAYWDYLSFHVGYQLRDRYQGEIDWTRYSYPLAAGNQTLKWKYQKDGYASAGSDCAWIDYIIFPPLVDHTSVDNIEENISFNLYPNPAENYIDLKLELDKAESVKIIIYDNYGRAIYSDEKSNLVAGNHTVKIKVNDFEAGMYNIVIQSDAINISRKFVKM